MAFNSFSHCSILDADDRWHQLQAVVNWTAGTLNLNLDENPQVAPFSRDMHDALTLVDADDVKNVTAILGG